jgi:hypothetical protein
MSFADCPLLNDILLKVTIQNDIMSKIIMQNVIMQNAILLKSNLSKIITPNVIMFIVGMAIKILNFFSFHSPGAQHVERRERSEQHQLRRRLRPRRRPLLRQGGGHSRNQRVQVEGGKVLHHPGDDLVRKLFFTSQTSGQVTYNV